MMAHDHTDSSSQNPGPPPYEHQTDFIYSSISTTLKGFRSFTF